MTANVHLAVSKAPAIAPNAHPAASKAARDRSERSPAQFRRPSARAATTANAARSAVRARAQAVRRKVHRVANVRAPRSRRLRSAPFRQRPWRAARTPQRRAGTAQRQRAAPFRRRARLVRTWRAQLREARKERLRRPLGPSGTRSSRRPGARRPQRTDPGQARIRRSPDAQREFERTERGERPARSFDNTLPSAPRRFGDDRPARADKPRGPASAARARAPRRRRSTPMPHRARRVAIMKTRRACCACRS